MSSKPSQLHAHLKQTFPEFSSNDRLSYLYSNWPASRTSNATSFATALSWWQNVLVSSLSLLSNDSLVLHANPDLLDLFKWDNVGRPACLGAVILELAMARRLIAVKEYMSSTTPVQPSTSTATQGPGWPRWFASNLVGKPMWWALRQLNIVEEEDEDELRRSRTAQAWKEAQKDWVLYEAVQKAGQTVQDLYDDTSHLSLTERLYTLENFRATFCPTLSSLDTEILLKYLSRDSPILLHDKNCIKFLSPSSPEVESITSTDHGILSIFSTRSALNEQITSLEIRIADKTNKIKSLLASQSKSGQFEQVAKTHLKARKELERVLLKRTEALGQLESVVLSIEGAASDVEMMRSYSTASETLKELLKAPELQKENVETTMDNLSELMADQKEVEAVIQSGGREAVDVDEDELEKELKGLVDQEKQAEQQEKERKLLEDKVPKSRPEKEQGTGESKESEQRPEKRADAQLAT